MQGKGISNSVPAKYRITLALSVAFLAHTLLFSGFPSISREPSESRETIRFELIPPGTITSQAGTPSTSTDPSTSRNPRFEVAPVAPWPSHSVSRVTASSSSTSVSKPEPSPRKATQQRVSQQTSAKAPTEASPPGKGAASDAGGQETSSELQPKENLTRITQAPTEQDPYLIKLAAHLGQELEKLRVPALSRLTQAERMEIELQLLGNGALTRARILKPTGVERIDNAAYRAALAASPYPEPPAEGEDQNRFEVELVFSPERF
ncbi:energy transducer TonB [Marinobacter sediminum]|nr:energy transducer TonB [Marinobacter sediminum]MCM0611159.1 energy transducer TonB [Marinobacter sediminum]